MSKKTTLAIIAYDISNDKRRAKLHKLLCGYGQWTQYSLFECYLTDKDWVRLRHDLDSLGLVAEDTVRIYPLCARCADKVETRGSPKPEEATVFLA
jgi:CRISPR-associated protein Cas2